ncbi:MAG: poly(A) polymerase [bacterium]
MKPNEGPLPVPVILPRPEHNVSRSRMDPDAVKVMYRLVRHGFKGYLVGGSVRDLLLSKTPKDFDVATDARPGEIRKLFHNCRIIGRRFRIVHVYFRGSKIIEVSTFRKDPEEATEGEADGQESPKRGDNTFGLPHEDALRRDLTINGLFYDIRDFSVIDYVGGISDLRSGIIRAIGEPDARFRDDPVRMIRAVRHAARTGFTIEPRTYQAILRNAPSLTACNVSRLQDELQKDLAGGHVRPLFELHRATGLMGAYFPALQAYFDSRSRPEALFHPVWTWTALARLDAKTDDPAWPPAYYLASLVFPLIERELMDRYPSLGEALREPTDVHRTLKELGVPFGIRRKDQERLGTLWFGFVRFWNFLQAGRIPERFRKRPAYQEALQFYLFHQILLGRSDEQIRLAVEGAWEQGPRPPTRGRRQRRRRRKENRSQKTV